MSKKRLHVRNYIISKQIERRAAELKAGEKKGVYLEVCSFPIYLERQVLGRGVNIIKN